MFLENVIEFEYDEAMQYGYSSPLSPAHSSSLKNEMEMLLMFCPMTDFFGKCDENSCALSS
jgi:hypothetical protein